MCGVTKIQTYTDISLDTETQHGLMAVYCVLKEFMVTALLETELLHLEVIKQDIDKDSVPIYLFIYPIQQSLGFRPSTQCHDKVFVCVSKLFWVGVKCVCNVWVL